MRPAFAADANAVTHVLVAELPDELVLEGDDGHHLARVRRLRSGERVTAADGRGRWRAYVVAAVGRGRLVLRATDPVRQEPVLPTKLVLAFSPTKGGQPERVVQHATELGVDRVQPLITERTVVRWEGARRRVALGRLERVARESAAQSFRSRLPEIGPPVTTRELADREGVIVADRGGPRRLDPPGTTWTVAIGPEGGFSPTEADMLGSKPRLGLGDLVLRAETAALAACTILATLRES